MSQATRVVLHQHTLAFLPRPPLHRHLRWRIATTICRRPCTRQHIPRRPSAIRSAIDPLTLLVAAAISFGIAYAFTKPLSNAAPASALEKSGYALDEDIERVSKMAAQALPGRPGNLTREQEGRLKEMWAVTLDVFGVSKDETHTNGAPTSPTTPETPERKKKRKGRLSLFGKKGKDSDGTDGAPSSDDNDKHGQTKAYQQALASQSPESLRAAFWSMAKHDHPDALLLRFLRARKWDVQAALVMLVSTMHWRSQDMHVDDEIMLNGEAHAMAESQSSNAAERKEGADFMAQLRMGKSFLHGTDKDGRPCCYVRVRLHRQGEQSERSLERFTVYTIETARMLLRPPVDTATIVFDMTDFSMANMDYTPVKFMIKCFEANYPESLGSVVVYKSPWIFQGIWKIIKGWLDPVVASKVHFASNVDELQECIPRSRIMKELGGDEAYTYRYIEPQAGEHELLSDSAEKEKVQLERMELVKSYESETISWMSNEDEGQGRTRLAERLAANYWRLDPFIRARSLYDRQALLAPGGKLDFYPSPSRNGPAHEDGVD